MAALGVALVVPTAAAIAGVPSAAAPEEPAGASDTAATMPSEDLTLWYDEPATQWESQTLPIGNGALGAAVFGGVETERLQFNEKTLWTGGPGSQQGYDFGNWRSPRPGALEEVQQRIDDELRVGPSWVAQKLGQPRRGYGSYQTFGEVNLSFGDRPAGVTAYRRYLDITEAVAGVTYTAGGVRYRREYFASAADDVIVARITADQPGQVSLRAAVSAPANRSKTISAEHGRITLAGNLADNGMRFESQLQVVNHGGSRVDSADGSVTVDGADAVTLMLAAGTNYSTAYPAYRGEDPHPDVTARVDAAAQRPYSALLADHVADYRALFDRVTLDVGQQPPDLPTDELLAAYRSGQASAPARKALEVLYFQYGRYLLIASSRDGSLPANLQGVWNNSTSAPWSADYHVNINLQMNYWPAEIANLTETTAPLFDYVDSLVPPGQVTADEMFGNSGWVVHNETTPFGFTGVHDWATAFWFPEAAAWLAQHYYEHYLFTQDEAFLRDRAYPVMKQLAEFWMDELVTDPRDARLVVNPSYSPEHGDFSAGASMSQQIVWDLLTNVVEAAEALGEADFAAEATATLDELDPGIRVGSWGQLQEWKEDWDDPDNQHRHVSHLFALHPGRQISPLATPELAEAAEVSLTARGDGGTGWSKAWKINFWARLLDGNHAHTMLSEQLKHSTLPNLWDTHPPFQIDGNFGGTAGVVEMLLQSQHGVVDVLPALPDAWADGSVTGLRARGDVTVDVDWAAGTPTRIALHAGQDGPLTVRSSLFDSRFVVKDATSGHPVDVTRDGDQIRLDAVAGHEYVAVAQVGLTIDAPGEVAWGETFPVEVTGTAIGSRTVPAATLTLQVPDGWTVEPAEQKVLPMVRPGRSRTFAFEVTAGDGPERARLTGVLAGDGWTARGVAPVATSDPSIIDQRQMSVVDVDSEETAAEDGSASNVLDGNQSTYWHTKWAGGADPLPHHIVLDLGAEHAVTKLRYLPRQDSGNGRIAAYEIYLSADGSTWGEPVATGAFPPGAAEQVAALPGTPARYLKLVATGSHSGPWTTVAEVNVSRKVDQ